MAQHLRRLSDLSDFKVASDDPDVRGWAVKTRDGREVGEVEELIVDPDARKVRYLEVDLDRDSFGLRDEKRVSIPIESAEINQRDHAVLVSGLSREAIGAMPASQYSTGPSTRMGREETVTGRESSAAREQRGTAIPRTEEELHVGTRRHEAGEVVVGKHVETEHVSEPVSVERERVHVERRPVTGETRAREGTFQDEEIRIPVVEEEIITEKRPVVKEELVVGKETVRDTEHVEADLRKERFDVRKDGRVIDEDDRTRSRRGGH